jgi:hypothetical protein
VDLLTICASAFVAVFVLLAILAAAMRLIMLVFPAIDQAGTDSSVVAAIHAAAHRSYPGKRITKIEEIKK